MMQNLFLSTCKQKKKSIFLLAGLTAGTGLCLLAISYLLTQIMQSAWQENFLTTETAPIFLVLFLLFLLRAYLGKWRQKNLRNLSANVRQSVRDRLHQCLCQNELSLEPGKLVTSSVETVDALDNYFTQVLPELCSGIVLMPMLLFVSLCIDPLTALLFLITCPIAPFLLYLIGKVTKTASEAQWQKLLQLTNGFYEILHGMVTLKIFQQTERQYQNLRKLSQDFTDTSLKVLQIAFVSSFALELITTLSIAIIAVGIGLRLLAGSIAFDTAFFLLLITPEFYQPLRNGGLCFHAFMNAQTAEKELQSILQKNIIPHDKSNFVMTETFVIRCQNVSFRYPQTHADIIANFSAAFKANEKIILCGESGSGKSTLLKLLAHLLTPTNGSIQYAKNTTISYVPQTPHLFAATLRENINLFAKADDNEIFDALQLANLADWAKQLPQGLDTKLGDGGLTLSRGQLQRLGLARAFCQNCNLILLDEPTAGLDATTEQQILAALTKFSQGRTLIVASHRPAVIQWGDQIVTIAPPAAKEVP